jgi:hypothetical protein
MHLNENWNRLMPQRMQKKAPHDGGAYLTIK